MTHSSVKAIVSDMDGTLLTSSGTIHPSDLHIIRNLHKEGMYFFIATGRHINFVLPFIQMIGCEYVDAVISLSGAAVYIGSDLTLLHQIPISQNQAFNLVSYMKTTNANGSIYTEHIPFFHHAPKEEEPGPLEFFADQKLLYTYKKDYFHLEDYKPGLGGNILKCAITNQSMRFFDTFCDRFSALSLCIYPHTDDTFSCEITNASVDKTAGLQTAAAYYQLSLSDLLTIGDSRNDLDMLEAAGYAATPRHSSILSDGSLTPKELNIALYHSHPVFITSDHNTGILKNIMEHLL